MNKIDEAKVDIKKIGKIFIFLIMTSTIIVFLSPEIFGPEVIVDLAIAGILIIILITIVVTISNKFISNIESKEIDVTKSNNKSSWKLPPIIYYTSIVIGVICIVFSVNGFLSGELTMTQKYTSRGILVTRNANPGSYWLAVIAFGFSGVILIAYPIINKIKYKKTNRDT